MFVTVITDCFDENAKGRQIARISTLFNCPASVIGVHNDIEASGNLIEILEMTEKKESIIYVNVAPRGVNTGHSATFLDENVSCKEPVKAKKWPNGTPFGYFYHGQTLVVASIDGFTLSLLKKFNITNKINVMDIPTVMDYAISKDMFPADMRDFVVLSQFRSNDFVPRACNWLYKGVNLPYEELSLDKVLDAPKSVWFIDIFGNCKTTLLPKDIDFEVSKKISLSFGEATMYNRLKDVPNGELAVIIGSSGYHKDRFLEIVIQGKSVAKKFNILSGQSIF